VGNDQVLTKRQSWVFSIIGTDLNIYKIFIYYKTLMNNQNNYIIKTNHHGTDLSNVYFKIFQQLVSWKERKFQKQSKQTNQRGFFGTIEKSGEIIPRGDASHLHHSCCRSSLNLLQQRRKWISSSTSPESHCPHNLWCGGIPWYLPVSICRWCAEILSFVNLLPCSILPITDR
jgi:hypothetical protein